MDNKTAKEKDKTAKYAALRWELKQSTGYEVKQYNVIIDVLGGWSEALEAKMKELVGERSKHLLKRMQKVVLSHSLNIARSFKILL